MIQFTPEPGGRAAFDAFLHSLRVADWESATGPMRFSSSLTPADLAGSTFFQNARRFFAALEAAGSTPATATGNLNRVFVRQMFDRLILPEHFRGSTLLVCKVINELVGLGLLERRPQSDWNLFTEKDKVRVSALWRKLIHFEHWAGGRG
jgi:hypothetical protein